MWPSFETSRSARLLRMRSGKANGARAGFSQFAPRQALSPCFFAAPGTPSWWGIGCRACPVSGNKLPARPEKNRGRAGRQGSGAHAGLRKACANKGARTHGPRRLATSRLVEVLVGARLPPDQVGGSARHAASPPNPRRPARGVCEVCSAPSPVVEPFVTPARLQSAGLSTVETLATQPAMLLTARRPTSRQRGLGVRYGTPGCKARLGPPGEKCTPHLRRSSPGHRSPPRVWRR
jgi:hypothetical protein